MEYVKARRNLSLVTICEFVVCDKIACTSVSVMLPLSLIIGGGGWLEPFNILVPLAEIKP